MGILDSISNMLSGREIKALMKRVDAIEALEPGIQKLSNEELRAKTNEFRKRLESGETLDDILNEAYAVVREAAIRTVGLRHFRVQLLGGIVLHEGRISEMKTGEGKTLVATLPLYLNALTGKGAHLVTVNDYLASYQKEWMGQIYTFLGLSVSCLVHGLSVPERREAYLADITYGTNNEFGFDYLRDNMALYSKDRVQRPLNYAIVDEVDSILVDEARTPLIISGRGTKTNDLYERAENFARTLREDDISIDEKAKSVVLTDESGLEKAERHFSIENLSDPENMELSHHINQAMKAKYIMKRDIDYVVKDGEVVIVDEFTGRLMFGRRYSSGLHQAIEAKEGIKVKKETQTLATITIQNYFRMYNKLAGMTGTAKTEEEEFRHIYNMDVVVIPTNKPVVRDDMADVIYKSMDSKFRAIIDEVANRHATGQPVLVGTVSVETSEHLSKLLKRRGIAHEVLNAKYHEREAEIVSLAGRHKAVTIATNMAGRGTDIMLGGNPEYMARKMLEREGYDEGTISFAISPLPTERLDVLECREKFSEMIEPLKEETAVEHEKVIAAGGLHIIGTERHESRRIDNQLRGRSGRQGDVGSSQFFLSMEDDLLRLFMSENVTGMLEKVGLQEDMPIEAGILTKSIERAQKKVESRNFGIRKHVLQYDDVINKQREIIYGERNRVLDNEDLQDSIKGMLSDIIDDTINLHTSHSEYSEEWDYKGMFEHLHPVFLYEDILQFEDPERVEKEEIKNRLTD